MLSYQHIYHAGNPADVHKHAALAAMLAYLTQKDKPLSYIETHGGRGLYDLAAPEAAKTGEAAAGIDAVLARGGLAGSSILAVLDRVRAAHGPRAYPGSPLIAAHFLRAGDAGHVAELHPREHAALEEALAGTALRVYRQDGFEMAQSICPPTPRRGLVLIDPSYEVKADYDTIPQQIARLHRKWNVGVIVLWYPILIGGPHGPMLRALEAQGLPGALRHEVSFPPVRAGHRMVGSGLFVVNAPWGLEDDLATIAKVFAG
ncbi:23S rRNA (adenine(2030)-N(6))-methyltransferase RlmJ [Lacimonas salitolerans]|uniref:Ribosomal RNA large subunit methyltransferase J n=1 Tax=Lacimonas salitolerans TaxID=1323750 RepID=A0ABW4EDQ7_9RHOB